MKKLLFVCTANQQRSRTAEELFRGEYETKSAGIHPFAESPLTKEAVLWADIIFCMEEMHRRFILEKFPEEAVGKKIVVLNIPDIYIKGDERLIKLLKERVIIPGK